MDRDIERAVDLGLILKKLGHKHSMAVFDHRLQLQKKIYTLQMFGINLGYDFSYYLRGPYCAILTDTGHELEKFNDVIKKFPENLFLHANTQKKFNKAKKFIKQFNIPDLEMATSLHLLHKSKKYDRDTAINDIEFHKGHKIENFSVERCKEIWEILVKEEFVE